MRVSAASADEVFLFSVESAANDKAMLRPCNTESKQFATSRGAGERLRITAGTTDGVLRGQITVDRYLVASRMLMVDNPPLEFDQRRVWFRVAASLPVDVAMSRGEDLLLTRALTLDVSQGGMAVIMSIEPLPNAGDLVGVVLHAPGQPVVAVVEVLGAHPDKRSTVRMRFHQISPLDQTLLASDLRRIEVTKVRTPRLR